MKDHIFELLRIKISLPFQAEIEQVPASEGGKKNWEKWGGGEQQGGGGGEKRSLASPPPSAPFWKRLLGRNYVKTLFQNDYCSHSRTSRKQPPKMSSLGGRL